MDSLTTITMLVTATLSLNAQGLSATADQIPDAYPPLIHFTCVDDAGTESGFDFVARLGQWERLASSCAYAAGSIPLTVASSVQKYGTIRVGQWGGVVVKTYDDNGAQFGFSAPKADYVAAFRTAHTLTGNAFRAAVQLQVAVCIPTLPAAVLESFYRTVRDIVWGEALEFDGDGDDDAGFIGSRQEFIADYVGAALGELSIGGCDQCRVSIVGMMRQATTALDQAQAVLARIVPS